jgi:hypothetical protein
MNLIEIIPAHGYEHRREIRRMAKDIMGPGPVWGALGELGSVLLAGGLLSACVLLFVRWWMGL